MREQFGKISDQNSIIDLNNNSEKMTENIQGYWLPMFTYYLAILRHTKIFFVSNLVAYMFSRS